MSEKSDCALAQIRHRHRPRSHPLSPTLAMPLPSQSLVSEAEMTTPPWSVLSPSKINGLLIQYLSLVVID